VVVAAWRQVAEDYAGKRVALVVCGGNVSMEVLRQVLA